MDPLTRLPTLRHDLTIDRGMSFEAAAARLAHERGECSQLGFTVPPPNLCSHWLRAPLSVQPNTSIARHCPAASACPALQPRATAAASASASAPCLGAPCACWRCRSRGRATSSPSAGPTQVGGVGEGAAVLGAVHLALMPATAAMSRFARCCLAPTLLHVPISSISPSALPGPSYFEMDIDELNQKYSPVTGTHAQRQWGGCFQWVF